MTRIRTVPLEMTEKNNKLRRAKTTALQPHSAHQHSAIKFNQLTSLSDDNYCRMEQSVRLSEVQLFSSLIPCCSTVKVSGSCVHLIQASIHQRTEDAWLSVSGDWQHCSEWLFFNIITWTGQQDCSDWCSATVLACRTPSKWNNCWNVCLKHHWFSSL